MGYETLLIATEEHVATVTLNRPKVLNALNAAMFRELEEAFNVLADDREVRVVLLRGAGGKAFAAGADISELIDVDASSGEALAGSAQRVFRRIETSGKPVIASIASSQPPPSAKPSMQAITGFALGGGCELAMACTLR